jgi:hypothetical protein
MNNGLSKTDIENEAYGILLEYMESKTNMQVGNIELLQCICYYPTFLELFDGT